MAKNWSLRRSVVHYAEKVQDASTVLQHYIGVNNYCDVTAVTNVMRNLNTLQKADVNAAIARAEASVTVMENLLEVLKNELKRKEAAGKLTKQHEESSMKETLKNARVQDLNNKMNPHDPNWGLRENEEGMD